MFFDQTIADPSNPAATVACRAWQRIHGFDHGSKRAAVTVEWFRLEAWATPGAVPVRTEVYSIGPEPVPAEYGQPDRLTPFVPAVYGDPDPETGERPLVSPSVDPTYGPAPLLTPRIPSYDEVFVEILPHVQAIGGTLSAILAARYGGTPTPPAAEG